MEKSGNFSLMRSLSSTLAKAFTSLFALLLDKLDIKGAP